MSENLFCELDKDEKTFKYMKMFIEELKDRKCKDIGSIGNRIQKEEIYKHLERNGLSWDNETEKNKWIVKNARGFRSYLNTIKIASLSFMIRHKDCSSECSLTTVNYENFCRLVDDMNSMKIDLIDTVF